MALRLGGTLEAARTTALCTLILSQLIHVFECKSETKSLFHLPLWNNWKLLAAVAVSASILFAAVESSALQMIFTTVPLSLPLWIVVAVSSCAIPICSAILFQITAKNANNKKTAPFSQKGLFFPQFMINYIISLLFCAFHQQQCKFFRQQ